MQNPVLILLKQDFLNTEVKYAIYMRNICVIYVFLLKIRMDCYKNTN